MTKGLSRAFRLSRNILAILVLLFGIIGLNLLLERNNRAGQEVTKSGNRLNVAVVNEDQAVLSQDGKDTYDLGDDYIKTLERDNTQNWTVTSRSSAESGLSDGNYQLMVIIPSDFSSKVLDINNVLVDKTTVSYKINAKGNSVTEADAQKVGSEVVSDLNSRLVNMYMASVLGNLYTAQENAKSVSEIQSGNIGDYQTNLLDSAVNFETVFPSLVSLSDNAFDMNTNLMKSLEEAVLDAKADQLDTDKMQADLATLTRAYSTGKIDSDEYTSGLMSMDSKALDSQLPEMIAKLETDQQAVSSQLGKPNSSNGNNISEQPTVKQRLENLKKRLDSAKEKVKQDNSVKPVSEIVDEFLVGYYGKEKLEELDKITLREVLTKKDKNESALLSQDLNAYTSSLDSMVGTAVKSLPADKASDLADLKGVTDTDYTSQITTYNDSKSASAYGYADGSDKPGDSAGLGANLSQAAKELRDFDKTTVDAKTEPHTQVKASLQDPKGVVESWYVVKEDGSQTDPVGSDQAIDVDLGQKNTFHYNFKTSSPGAQAEPNDSSATLAVELDGVSVTTTDAKTFDPEAYADKVEAYTKSAQAVVDAYNHAGSLLATYYPDGNDQSITERFFDQSARSFLTDILTQQVSKAVPTYSGDVDVTSTFDDLEKGLNDVIATNDKVEADISDTLGLLKEIQSDQKASNSPQAQAEADKRDKAGSDLTGDLSDLISQSEALKSTSESNAESAKAVNESFDSFNESAKEAQDQGQKLSADSKRLMAKFNEELEDTNDFVGSFKKVLDNAYQEGVPNESLLEFLSSPVVSRSSSYQSRVNTYRPFTWILLLAVVTLFTAYIFATQDLLKRVRSKFTKGVLSDTDPLNVGTISGLGLVEGLGLGITSARNLHVPTDMVPSWILLFVLYGIVLLLAQFFLIKRMHALGMGISLYVMVSFVYFSSAVGASSGLTGLLKTLKVWNPLSHMEKTLSAYFDNIAVNIGEIFLLVLVLIILAVLNTLVRLPWEAKMKQPQSQTEA